MKTTVNNNVNQIVKNLSRNATESLNSILHLARMFKEQQDVAPSYDTETYNMSQEAYDKIKAILRLTGNDDIPVSAYVDAVLLDFLLTHDENGMKEFANEIIERRK